MDKGSNTPVGCPCGFKTENAEVRDAVCAGVDAISVLPRPDAAAKRGIVLRGALRYYIKKLAVMTGGAAAIAVLARGADAVADESDKG